MCYATIKLKHAFACKINIILYNFYIEFFRFLCLLFAYANAGPTTQGPFRVKQHQKWFVICVDLEMTSKKKLMELLHGKNYS